MLNQTLTRGQMAAALTTVILCIVLLAWGLTNARGGFGAAHRPVEIQPVREEITSGADEVAPAPSGAPISDEQARSQEALQSLKAQAQRQLVGK